VDLHHGDKQHARETMDRLLGEVPDDPSVLFVAGMLYRLDGLYERALEMYDRALELNPNHADALTAKGGLYRQLPRVLGGNLNVAENCLTKAISLDPEAVSARIELAATYREMGHPERGVPLLQQAATIAEQKGKTRQLREARDLMRELQDSVPEQSSAY
jgi:tetratricopeptide (TPR) repeat protein